MSKSKLVLVNKKSKSLTQLELQAVLIVSLLKQKIIKEFKIPIKETFMSIILHYLQNEDHNFGIYVSHRVNEILEHTKLNEWNYVSSESNILILQTKLVDIKLSSSYPLKNPGLTVQHFY